MPHGNQSESECLLGGKIGKIGKIPGILRVYLEKPGYTRVIPALLHGFAPGTTPTAATTTENPAYHFRIPLYHTTPKLIKISPNTGLIPVNIQHWLYSYRPIKYRGRPAQPLTISSRDSCELRVAYRVRAWDIGAFLWVWRLR